MENNSLSRNQLHEKAMQIMYSFLLTEKIKDSKPIDFKEYVSEICELPYDDCDLFLKQVLIKALKNEKEIIDEIITPRLVNWKFDRLNLCIQAILIIACSEYFYLKDIEKPIVIDVAIKLAKRYGDKEDYKFVNGILDKCLTSIEQ